MSERDELIENSEDLPATQPDDEVEEAAFDAAEESKEKTEPAEDLAPEAEEEAETELASASTLAAVSAQDQVPGLGDSDLKGLAEAIMEEQLRRQVQHMESSMIIFTPRPISRRNLTV